MATWFNHLKQDWPRAVSLVLAILGLLVSLYLTWVKVARTTAFCGGVGECESVNNSPYSEINGVPIAVLGAGAYLLIGLLLALENTNPQMRQIAPLAIFGLSLTGTLYSAYLTYIELFVLHAVCPYCVVSAVLITALLGLALYRVLRSPAAPPA